MADNLALKLTITADGKIAVEQLNAVAAAEHKVGVAANDTQEQVSAAGEKQLSLWGRMGAAIGTVRTALIGLATVGAARSVILSADEVRILSARIDYMTKASGDAREVWEDLYSLSQRNGQAIGDTVTLFQRMQMAAERLGASNKDILRVVSAVQALGRESGATTEEIKSASIQLAQALQAPLAQWEEFSIIQDSAPALTKEIEKLLKLVPGGLKAAVEAGLSTQKVFDGLVQGADAIVARTDKIAGSIGEATTALGNSMMQLSGAADQAVGGFSGWLTGQIKEAAQLADNVAARLRRDFVANENGIDPRLTGQARVNALTERYNKLLKEGLDTQQQLAKWNPLVGIVPGATQQAVSANAALRTLQSQIKSVEQDIIATNAQILKAAQSTDALTANAKATQAALTNVNADYTGTNGFSKLKTDAKEASAAVDAMNQSLRGPAPAATVSDQLRGIIEQADQARASMETGDMATALSKIQEGAKAINAFVAAGGVADGTIGSLALEFERMSEAAKTGVRDGKDALDAIAKSMSVSLTVTPKIDEKALDAIVAKMRSAATITPADLSAAGLIGADTAKGPAQPSSRASLRIDAAPAADAARRVVEQAFKTPIPVSINAGDAASDLVQQISAALAAASFSIPVQAIVTPVAAPGSTDVSRAAAKVGTRTP